MVQRRQRQRKLLLWRTFLLAALYLLVYDSPFTGTGVILLVSAKQTPFSTSTSSGAAPTASKRGSLATTSPATANQTATAASAASVYQLTETEVYDDRNRVWKAADSSSTGFGTTTTSSSSTSSTAARWTDATGRASPAPDKLVPVAGTEFVGDWKIVTGSGRDAYGWEYVSTQASQSSSSTAAMVVPVRRRTWLRTLQPISSTSTTTSTPTTTTTSKVSTSLSKTAAATALKPTTAKQSTRKPTRKQKRRTPILPKFLLPAVWIRAVRDDFNFKGWGWTFYKSLQTTDSVGLALKLPLTYNFDTWERHPALPSVGSSVCVYSPDTIVFFVSGSMRVEWIKWASSRIFYYMVLAVCQIIGNLVRGLCLAVSAVLYPFTRTLYDPAWTKVDHYRNSQWTLDHEQQGQKGPNYSRTVEEFIGVSVSWRVSVAAGYEFRVGYWHYYAPSVVSIWRAVTDMCSSVIPEHARKSLQQKTQLPVWFARHSAALGLSTSAPQPDPPHVAVTGLLSLSGFYFQKDKVSSKKATSTTSTQSSSAATTSAKSAAAAMDISDSESDAEDLEENDVSSSKKKHVLLTASTATATTTKSPWQLLREKETAIAAELALESASTDKKKDKLDEDTSQKKKKSSNKKQPSLLSTSSTYL